MPAMLWVTQMAGEPWGVGRRWTVAERSSGSPCQANVSQAQVAHRPALGSSAAAAAQKHSTM
eukprot:10938976-Alexandrium_andersonii.AAC.1